MSVYGHDPDCDCNACLKTFGEHQEACMCPTCRSLRRKARIHDMGGPLLKPAVIRVSFGYDAPERPCGVRIFTFDIDDIVGFDWPDTERYCCTIGHMMVNHG